MASRIITRKTQLLTLYLFNQSKKVTGKNPRCSSLPITYSVRRHHRPSNLLNAPRSKVPRGGSRGYPRAAFTASSDHVTAAAPPSRLQPTLRQTEQNVKRVPSVPRPSQHSLALSWTVAVRKGHEEEMLGRERMQ